MAEKGISVDKVLKTGANKKRLTWSQTKRSGDITEEIRVEKLDNKGYLVTIRKDWYDTKGKWHDKELKLYSTANPLDEDETDNPADALFKMITRDKK